LEALVHAERELSRTAAHDKSGRQLSALMLVRQAIGELIELSADALRKHGPIGGVAPQVFLDAQQLQLADGTQMARWPDLSGAGRDGVQPDPQRQFTYHSALWTDGLPYVAAGQLNQAMTVPLPATATRTIFVVARGTRPFPNGSPLRFDDFNLLYTLDGSPGWRWYQKQDGHGTAAGGYSAECSVLCMRQDAADSISFFVDGALVETLSPSASPAAYQEVQLGPGAGLLRQFVVFDRALADAEVAGYAKWLRKCNQLNYQYEFVGSLAAPALVVRREGLSGPRPLVITNHAAGTDERLFHDEPGFRTLLTALLAAGYVVASSQLFGASWGNQSSLDANAELYSYVTTHYPIDPARVAMIGDSMGALPTLLAFPDARIPLAGAALYYPCCNLRHLYEHRFTEAIRVAYGIRPDGANYAAATSGHDPLLRAASDWTGARLRFYTSPADTVVSTANNAQAFSAHVAATAGEAGLFALDGEHNTQVETTNDDLLAFLARCFA
ncbi:MAG TPA: hypothetical protein VE775_03975, partial [Pyrinomonadaceae bacterium]|nr:hypothetical protein [Pyrinomonadaceae bacterium]